MRKESRYEWQEVGPSMAAGVIPHLHDMDWLLDMIDEVWPRLNRPKTYRKPETDTKSRGIC